MIRVWIDIFAIPIMVVIVVSVHLDSSILALLTSVSVSHE